MKNNAEIALQKGWQEKKEAEERKPQAAEAETEKV